MWYYNAKKRQYITRLRRKIGACSEHIVTRPGYGYGFEA